MAPKTDSLLKPRQPLRHAGVLSTLALLASLAACGGGDAPSEATAATAADAADTPSVTAAGALPSIEAAPTFHAAPLDLQAPADVDRHQPMRDAEAPPHEQAIPAELAPLGTRGLTREAIDTARRRHALGLPASGPGGAASPLAGSGVATYTPAQVRAAYGLPNLPAFGAGLTALQLAQLGAGQTIYLIGARHDPNIAAELAAFNLKFALPNCTTKPLAIGTSLPLPAASPSGCEFSQVMTTTAGAMTTTAPAYDAGWATEMALDVQWAHATAPLARIVLIEAPDASVTSLVNAIGLANRMGPGVVSMSFGATEGSWTASAESAFSGASMSYVAATGDSGYGVSWPSVSARVLAVGGTSLGYAGTGTRSETAWSGTGGGISQYTPAPAYQANTVPGLGMTSRRIVADVAFNANPSTGQYVAVIAPGSSTASWLSVGGTSLATPQWAGLLAVANALRAASGKAALGAPHAALYGQIASVPGSYAADFADITSGTHGSCSTCAAKGGYDELTGIGTPNAAALLNALTGAAVTAAPPPVVVAPPALSVPALNGIAGKAFSGSIGISAPAATSLSASMAGMPSGMKATLSATALTLSWTSPVAGSYNLTVIVADQAGRSSKATVPITIAKR